MLHSISFDVNLKLIDSIIMNERLIKVNKTQKKIL